MLIKAILIAILAGFLIVESNGSQMIRRPLPISLFIGLILGEVTEAITIGATLELTWLGLANVGGSSPAEMIMGSVVGVSLGVLSGGGTATGIALAIPVSLLCVQLGNFLYTFNVIFVHAADKVAEEGDYDKITKLHIIPGLIIALVYTVIAFLAVYYGSGVVEDILAMIPEEFINGLTTASYALPAIGLGILMTMIFKDKKMWAFTLMGFTLVSYLGLSMIALAFVGVTFAVMYDLIMGAYSKIEDIENGNVSVSNAEEDLEL